MHAKKTNKTKLAVVLLAVVLLIGCTAGATLAWLMDSTPAVVNTFTTSDIDIELTENTGSEYKMIPGSDIAKDPKVTVKGGSEACYLFVKVDENIGEVKVGDKKLTFGDFLDYDVDTGDGKWTALDGETNVYYRKVDASNADQVFNVIKDNKVIVNEDVTKAMMNAFDTNANGVIDEAEKAALPTLTFTAYAVQQANIDSVADAWTQAKTLIPTT